MSTSAIVTVPSSSLTAQPCFNDLVAESIVAHSDVRADQIIVLDNSVKYSPETLRKAETYEEKGLSEIFDAMSSLNRGAMETPDLCRGKSGGLSFREALLRATSQIITHVKGRPVRYVELGPEPWKCSAILKAMLAADVNVVQYIGLDINPESERAMEAAVAPIVGEDRFSYWVQDFYRASWASYPKLPGQNTVPEDLVTVVTNLGFQEGNDLPSKLGPMLSSITRPGDLVLSEMQVFRDKTDNAQEESTALIRKFYLHPEMRHFSALVEKRIGATEGLTEKVTEDGPTGSQYRFLLVPVSADVGKVKVAATLRSLQNQTTQKYVLTNSCLKYTCEQFKRAREGWGSFKVKSQTETGDESVIFQISERY